MLGMIISGKLWNNPLFASVIYTYITSSSHLPPTPPPLHLFGPPVQPCWATSAASSQSSLTWCWPACPVVAASSTPPSQPLANPYVPPPRPLASHTCLDAGHLVLELPLRNLRSLSQTLFYLEAGYLVLKLALRHLRGLCQTLFTWRLATLSWSCLCATSAASVKPSLPGGWPPYPGAASASSPQPLSIFPGISC